MLKRLKNRRRVNRALKQPMTAEIYARILTGIYMAEYDYLLNPTTESQEVFDTLVAEVAETYNIGRGTALALCGAAMVHHRIAEDELNRRIGD